MSFDLPTRNFVALVLQASAVGAIGFVLPVLFRVRAPRPLLHYWQALLGLILLLPALQALVPAGTAGTGSLPVLRFSATGVAGSHGLPAGRSLLISIVSVALIRLSWLAAGFGCLLRYRQRSLPVAGSPTIRISRDIAGPVSFGILHPVILLPESWRSLSSALQTAVVCHEQTHIRRNDWTVHLIEELIRSVLWFQPAIWYIVSQIRLTREQVVDLEVVRKTGAPDVYIQALLAAADAGNSKFPLPAPCFVNKHQLLERVCKVKKEYRMSKRRIALSFAGIALVLLAGERSAVWSFPLQAAQAPPSGKVYRIKDGVTPPRLINRVEPEYTADAKEAHIAGTVVLSVEITPDGVAQNVQVLRTLDAGLDQKAVDAIQKWQFAPGLKDGEPVTVAATIEVNFRLK